MEKKTKELLPSIQVDNFQMDQFECSSSEDSGQCEIMKIKNRMAAKKCRDKKNDFLSKLELENDDLLREVLKLLNRVVSLKVENKILEENIEFLQNFLYSIMKKH